MAVPERLIHSSHCSFNPDLSSWLFYIACGCSLEVVVNGGSTVAVPRALCTDSKQ